MKRLLALLLLSPWLAFAQSSPNWPLGYQPSVQEWNAQWASKLDYGGPPNASVLYATDFGLVADGVTSMDAILKTATDACNAAGGKLILPPGRILLTGAATTTVNGCTINGAEVPAYTQGVTIPSGTTFYLTSTTVKPFILGQSGGFIGMNFYWPNQTNGVTVYPPLFNDDGTTQSSGFYFNKITIINAYDAWVQTSNSWGNFFFTESSGYAVHDLFQLRTTGGSFVLSDLLLGPGPWFSLCGACKTGGAGTAAAAVANIFHLTSGPGAVTISTSNINTFAWRHAFLLDAGSTMANSVMTFNFDGVATIIDATSGGIWAGQNVLSGFNSNCQVVNFPSAVGSGNARCFDMGANSNLRLTNYQGGVAGGDFIRMSAGSVFLENVQGVSGFALDGAAYSFLNATGNLTQVHMRNSSISGKNTVNDHGINANGHTISRLILENNDFGQENEMISAPYAPTTIITGNYSTGTVGSSSVLLTGSGTATFRTNQFDKPPAATIASGFGTSPTVLSQNEPNTFQVNVGTGGAATTGIVNMPISSNHGYACSAVNESNVAGMVTVANRTSQTTITLSNFSRTTGLAAAWAASSLVDVFCDIY